MENIWSENRKVNRLVIALLFLVSMNFMHYAQIILPVICLILFIDRHFRFKVNNIWVFISLCLFGLTFYIFSNKNDLYCFMGFFCPMAYYIGSNMLEADEKKVRMMIYLLAFGMIFHVLLNFGYDLCIRGIKIFRRNSHLDIWFGDEYPTTQTAVNYTFIIGCIYYIFIYEKNRTIKTAFYISFILAMIYDLALGRRYPIMLMGIITVVCIVIDRLILKNNGKKIRIAFSLVVGAICLIALVTLILRANLFNLADRLSWLSIVRKWRYFTIDFSRFNILIETLKLAPYHLFGKQEISAIIGLEPHNLWLDIYNYAGIFPFVFMLIYTMVSIINMVKILKDSAYDKKYRFLIFSLLLCIMIQMLVEPIMTGSSIFLLCSIITISMIESYIIMKR